MSSPGTDIEVVAPADLGAVLRAARIAAGLTQADAAALCGVSGPFLSGLERGKPTAQLGLALRVCAGLGVRVALRPAVPIGSPHEGPRRKPRTDRT